MKTLKIFTSLCAVLCAVCGLSYAGTNLDFELPEYARTFVLANSDDPDSLDVAKHYMAVRKIPEINLIAFPMPLKETISRKEFTDTIHNPLLEKMTERGLIDGTIIPNAPRDKYGRIQLAFRKNFDPEKGLAAKKISYLVLCRGVPLRIANDPTLLPALPPKAKDTDPDPKRGPLDVNNASVDSELAMVGLPGIDINGPVANPFFKTAPKIPGKAMCIKVARLDGQTKEQAKALVDNAVKAEKTGLRGRAYIDLGGPIPEGEKWLAACAPIVNKLGYDLSSENTKELMHPVNRYDAPALYFGWYNKDVGGFFLDKNFSFPPGAIAIHIHSFSATSMRSKTAWTPGLVARGVTATVGNVYEPFLAFTHLPHFFLEGLAAGMSAGEAAAYSNPVLSWQTIFVGDPLYRPFARSLDSQLADSLENPDKLSQYSYIRAMNLARDAKDGQKYAEISHQGKLFAVGLALAYRQFIDLAMANGGKATWTVALPDFTSENPGLLLETSRVLAATGNVQKAMEIYEKILSHNIVPAYIRFFVLREAFSQAQKYNFRSGAVTNWMSELERYQ